MKTLFFVKNDRAIVDVFQTAEEANNFFISLSKEDKDKHKIKEVIVFN
jgi:hypothetical protein